MVGHTPGFPITGIKKILDGVPQPVYFHIETYNLIQPSWPGKLTFDKMNRPTMKPFLTFGACAHFAHSAHHPTTRMVLHLRPAVSI
jgi:hypothetical protein